MRRLALATACFAAAAVALAGPSGARKPKPRATGAIKGRVVFDGTPPKPAKLERGSDPVCKKNKAPDQAVVVGDDGALRDAFVQVEDVVAPAPVAPDTPVVIEQVGCEYVPRVVGLVSGQTLQVENGDATLHNVHAYLDGKTHWNLAQPKAGEPIGRALEDTGVLELKCDVHPWMRAYAVYAGHGLFDVTGGDGGFEIRDVPVGKRTVSAWHPTLGRRTVEVEVTKRTTATADIHFDAN